MALFSGLRTLLKFEFGYKATNTKQSIYEHLGELRLNINAKINECKKKNTLCLPYDNYFDTNLKLLYQSFEELDDDKKTKFATHIQTIKTQREKKEELKNYITFRQKIEEIRKWVLVNL